MTKFDFNQAMTELEEINVWFDQEDIDLEEALTKLKKGKDLIQQCQGRLTEIENEFVELTSDAEVGSELSGEMSGEITEEIQFEMI